MIRLKPDELEAVAKHIPDAKDACERARTTLSWEPSSLAMDLPGVSTPAIEALWDELVHWLKRYEDKLNEAEELLYRAAAAMHQVDETLADNMKEFGLELLGWYDVQRVFGEYDSITGERLSIRGRLLAGGMLLASMVPPAKGAGMAGKAAIKGAKAIDAASALAKVKHVVRDDTMKTIFHTIYHQVIKAPFAETARLFKTQWDELVKSVASVSWQPAYAGVGPAPRGWMSEAKDASLNMIKKVEGEVVEKEIDEAEKLAKGTVNALRNVDDVLVKPLGRGTTGRTTPQNLNEQLAMKQVMSNPNAGRPVPIRKGMTDPRWPVEEGWIKMTQNVNGYEIHYLKNTKTGQFDDFKFKN
ncbi:pre-toxin TG domain-containing protein [Geobacillus icigianus]|uniref:Pre-toxin TG domain-containing protein n=1 Tax=Geobacillus subterraneus TaxID=129338 RepID=A0A679FPT4_9BACL|nr:pre-toxin TG domain-containing protein [Geobacillus subterraneus]BBW98642.1 hypothetical protein GsuE55_34750 [Geobacillus subterraneus]